jgi:hypothetical protein
MHDDSIIYAQVLLLDNKIEVWKICQDKKCTPYDFKAYWKQDRMNDYTMDTFVFVEEETYIADGWNFNSYVYNVLAPEWINEWEYADNYKGSKAKVSTLEEIAEDMKSIENAFGGRFKIIGTLGRN